MILSNEKCRLLHERMVEMARKYPMLKFVRIRGKDCIPNYPDKHLPTLLVYHQGTMVKQWVGSVECAPALLTKKLFTLKALAEIADPDFSDLEHSD